MSATASPPSSTAPRTPPEEQFWKRHSPHGEAPLSMVGSLTLHALVGGALFLFAVWLASMYIKSSRGLPIEPVRLELGGGGGKVAGKDGGKGIGHGAIEDVGKGEDDFTIPGLEENLPKLPPLEKTERQAIADKFAPADARVIAQSNNESARALARMEESIRKKLSDGLRPGKGKGGSGSGGGKDKGKGTGEGDGTGPGKSSKASLTQREKRMLRWNMRFTANSGPQYLKQLRELGAILAIPVREGATPEYKIIEDLNPPAKFANRDLSEIKRIYWIDDKPNSVRDIMAALRLPLMPSRFVAFMPESLEDKLYAMEKRYVEKVLRQPFNEERINETHFKVVFKGGAYVPEIVSVSVK